MVKSAIMIFGAVVIGAIGQLCIKSGVNQIGYIEVDLSQNPVRTLYMILSTPLILVAIPLYVAGYLLWVIVLSRHNLSFAYPLLALNFVLVPLASRLLLGETVEMRQWVGIGLIMVGVVVVLTSQQSSLGR